VKQKRPRGKRPCPREAAKSAKNEAPPQPSERSAEQGAQLVSHNNNNNNKRHGSAL
jgi:hypothetical protein